MLFLNGTAKRLHVLSIKGSIVGARFVQKGLRPWYCHKDRNSATLLKRTIQKQGGRPRICEINMFIKVIPRELLSTAHPLGAPIKRKRVGRLFLRLTTSSN
jgi:hypothetical protein